VDPPHPARCALLLRRQAPQQGWTLSELVEAIVTHCRHSRLRAHRLARGWTLVQLISEMVTVTGAGSRLVTSRVSRWERGEEQPSALYRDALCRAYRTGPVDLGLSIDYSAPAIQATADSRPQPRAVAATSGSGHTQRQRGNADHSDNTVAGGAAVQRAEMVRRRVDETLSASTLSDATVAYKESVADQYGRTYKTQPVAAFLDNILADLDDLQVLADRKLPSSQRRDLCAVTARLAGLVSMSMVNLGLYRQAREWVHTARLAADEAENPDLRAWVATRGAVASLHLGDPQAAATAAREAELLTAHHPGHVTAMAWAILARAAAIMAQPQAARTALRRAETVFSRVDGAGDNSAYVFTAGQLHFYTSHALTTIGETRAAWQAQDDALACFGPGERLDPTLVRLDRALCMVSDGDITQGVDYASTVLQDLPTAYRPAIVMRRAHAVAAAVPSGRRGQSAVRALHEQLAIDAATTR
jgi:transcriptional regulator with XRE-family HTH domain